MTAVIEGIAMRHAVLAGDLDARLDARAVHSAEGATCGERQHQGAHTPRVTSEQCREALRPSPGY